MAGVRLICFHHAGGASASFRRLIRALGPGIPVTAVNLPGRESRHREPRHRDMTACAAQLCDELDALLDQPHVLLGQSMGALIAFTIAQRRLGAGRRGPDALIVSGCAAPHLPSTAARITAADDRQLAIQLAQFGGLPAELLAQPEWLAALMPIVRDDLLISASHRDGGRPALPCPIHVFGGDADPLVTPSQLAGWSRYSREPQPVTILRGGHLLCSEPGSALIGGIGAILGAVGECGG